MISGTARWLLVTIVMLVAAVGCSPSPAPPPPRRSELTPASQPPTEYVALEAEIEKAISTGPAALDNVRAVLVNVDGETKIAHYRHGFTGDSYGHVFSVTKSVVSILIGIAIADGLIGSVDQPLAELLPKHRQAMSGDTAKVSLRQLLTMSGGFLNQMPSGGFVWADSAQPGMHYIDLILERRPETEPGQNFEYSDPGAHLVAAVLAAALEGADGDRPRTVLDYAREKLFDPLGISTHPAFSEPVPDVFAPEFLTAGFGWATDPNRIEYGAVGLRLRAPDMMKIGELCRQGGVWHGQQIVPTDWIRRSISPSARNPDYGLLWWILREPVGVGYSAAGRGGQHIIVLPKSRAVIVYLSEVQVGNEIELDDLEPLHKVVVAAFPE
jgi:CubicO group peptidase (beta-lactamase class C family)